MPGCLLWTVVGLAASLLPGLAAHGEEPLRQAGLESEIEVRLVDLEVFVTDADGRPVSGLSSADFEVLQDGERVEITHFSAVEGDLKRADERTEPLPDSVTGPFHLAIVIARDDLEPGDLDDLITPLGSFLRRHLDRQGQALLAVADHRGLEVRQPFTSLPGLLTEPLIELSRQPAGGRTASEFRRLLTEIQRVRTMGVDQPSQSPNAAPRALLAQIEALSEEIHQNLGRQTAALAQLVQAMAGLPGRRVVLYFGGRAPTRASRALFDAWQNAFGRSSDHRERLQAASGAVPGGAGDGGQTSNTGISSLFDGLGAGTPQLDHHRLWLDVAERASARDIVLHSVDVGALRGSSSFIGFGADPSNRGQGGAGSPEIDLDRALWEPSTLRALSEASGGRVTYGNRDFGSALEALASDFTHYYSLGFVPPQRDGETHDLEVRLRRPGVHEVRHRRLYRLQTVDEETLELMRSALWLGEAFNPLEVELAAGEPQPVRKKRVRLPLSVSVPLSRLALVAEGKVHAGQLSIFVAGDLQNGKATARKAVVPVRIANQDLLTSLGRRVEYTFDLELDLPLQPIAVAVRDDYRPLSSTAIHLPAAASATTSASAETRP